MDPGRGVDDESGGLVDDDDLFVLVDDVERYLFGRDLGGRRRGQLDLDALAPFELERGLGRAPADEHVAVINHALQGRTAHALDARREEGVETRARLLRRHVEDERLGPGLGVDGLAFRVLLPLVAHALTASAAALDVRRRRSTRKRTPPATTKRLMSCEVERCVNVVSPAMSPRGSSRKNSMVKRVRP